MTIMLITMTIMNMQNKLYTMQFFSPPNDQLTAPQKRFKLPVKTGFNSQKREEPIAFCSPANSLHKWSMMPTVWNISTAQLGCLPGCAPSQLLHPCSSAECEKLEKVLDFIATTENITVTNILLVLNSKHSSYREENYPS